MTKINPNQGKESTKKERNKRAWIRDQPCLEHLEWRLPNSIPPLLGRQVGHWQQHTASSCSAGCSWSPDIPTCWRICSAADPSPWPRPSPAIPFLDIVAFDAAWLHPAPRPRPSWVIPATQSANDLLLYRRLAALLPLALIGTSSVSGAGCRSLPTSKHHQERYHE